MKIRDDINENGEPVTWFKCDVCNQNYSICPAPAENKQHLYNVCSASSCDSYDPERDTDILFMSNRELADYADKITAVDIKMLSKRRKFQSGIKFKDLEDCPHDIYNNSSYF